MTFKLHKQVDKLLPQGNVREKSRRYNSCSVCTGKSNFGLKILFEFPEKLCCPVPLDSLFPLSVEFSVLPCCHRGWMDF